MPQMFIIFIMDEIANPGSILTFFPYGGLVREAWKGMLNTTTFSVASTSIGFWIVRQ